MRGLRNKIFWAAGASGCLAMVTLIVTLAWPHKELEAGTLSSDRAEDEQREAAVITVNSVHPKSDPSFQISVSQPAYVDPYYQADLMAQVAGSIKFVQKAIGDTVVEGERLAEIYAPQLVAEVALKQAAVAQKKKELLLTEANARLMQAVITVAENTVKEKESQVNVAEADRAYRQKILDRFKVLIKENGAVASVLDEQEKYALTAVAAKQTAQFAVATANSDVLEAREKLEWARTDIQLKQALVKVAEEDLARANAFLDFATIRAPFDGVITRRNIDPGSFVQNATTARTEPLLRVERTDIVTVYMQLPDVYAPYVTGDTNAIIEMSALPGVAIKGKVTRFTPSLQTPSKDRTMRVEVDLYNGTEEEYQKLLAREKALNQAGLKGGKLPVMPRVVKGSPSSIQPHALLPGMYGTMRLVLKQFKNALMLPSTAVVSHGGQNYIYLVVDGKAVPQQVKLELDDGKIAKVTLVVPGENQAVEKELTGKEEVIISNQGELRDGQAVRPNLVQW